MRVTNNNITYLEDGQIFVFGSNERGIHGGGAARQAYEKFGAVMFQGYGKAGNTFAIPTKDWSVQTLKIEYIQFYVNRFISFAMIHPEITFLVTEIGCGLAGYSPSDMAPLFKNCLSLSNIYLPERFLEVLTN